MGDPNDRKWKAEMRSLGESQFKACMETPGAWLFTAYRLRDSARVLRDAHFHAAVLVDRVGTLTPEESQILSVQHSMFHECSLLLAFAFENLFKGLWVAKNYPGHSYYLGDREGLLDALKIAGGHDLVILAAESDFNISLEEKELLKILTDFSIWRGR